MNKSNKGITLVALIITIIVLLILAGVSANVLIGENGIITKVKEAKYKSEESTLNEQIRLNEIIEYMNSIKQKEIAGMETKKPSNWTSKEIIAISDGNRESIPLPNGFYYVGGNINEGIVISDSVNDKNKGTQYETILEGNQFVWIPVKSEGDMKTTLFDSNGKVISGLDGEYTEPYINGYAKETEEFNIMKSKVIQYGGFYIGRYEAGDETNGTTYRTTSTTAHKVGVKKGIAPYNYVPWGKSINDDGEILGQSGAIYLSKNIYKNSNSVVSTLCYGSQWDAMCRYIGDSQLKAELKSLSLTGSKKEDVSKNIYDLAGNGLEWTREAYNTYNRVFRGGYYNFEASINARDSNYPTIANENLVFRCTLYIK